MKKGFTLVELLGAIVILGLIALIATPPIVNLVKKSDKTISENNLKLIYKAGLDYINEFQNNYSLTKNKKVCLSIQEIVDNGNLKDSFIKQQKIDTKKYTHYTVGDKMKLSYDLKLYNEGCNGAEIIPTDDPQEKILIYASGGKGELSIATNWYPFESYTDSFVYSKIEETFQNTSIATKIKNNEVITSANTISDGLKINISRVRIPSKGYVLVSYNCNNSEQVASDVFPVASCLDYEVSVKQSDGTWLADQTHGLAAYGTSYGDYERIFLYVSEPGDIEIYGRVGKYPDRTIESLKQTLRLDVTFIEESKFPLDVKK